MSAKKQNTKNTSMPEVAEMVQKQTGGGTPLMLQIFWFIAIWLNIKKKNRLYFYLPG